MVESDRNLLKQMLHAGRFNNEIYHLLCQLNKTKSQELIKEMGEKWCCHPSNAVKRLEVPLEILKQNQSKVLKGNKNGNK